MIRSLIVAIALLFAVPARAAPSFSVAAVSCPEGGPCAVTIRKSAKASSYSKVQVTTIDGTAKAGVDYSALNVTLTIGNSTLLTSVPLTIASRAGYQGNRAFAVHIMAVRNAVVPAADAAVTIVENAPAPAPGPSGTWVAAPLQMGGYARAKITTPGYPKGQNPTANQYNYQDVYRSAQAGEVFRVYPGGAGYSWDNRVTFSLMSLTYHDTVILYADDIEGIAAAVGTTAPSVCVPTTWCPPGW